LGFTGVGSGCGRGGRGPSAPGGPWVVAWGCCSLLTCELGVGALTQGASMGVPAGVVIAPLALGVVVVAVALG